MKFFTGTVFALIILSCKAKITPPNETFTDKWYAGKAELNSYALEQARYGEIRNGEAVLVFVTEDFSIDKLVKLDNPANTNEKVRVLKMNMTKNFVTGVYPYSMMLSAFTPVSKSGKEKTVKVDCSSQEWCGHTFSQLRLKGDRYKWALNSYFESEAGQTATLEGAVLEDELWNRIRINPSELPQGQLPVIPGLLWQRLSHVPLKPANATLTISKADTFFINNQGMQMYTIHYPGFQRTLQIYFRQAFPYEIMGWQESYPDGQGDNKKMLITKAILKRTAWLDYWNHNSIADSTYRNTLQLMRHE